MARVGVGVDIGHGAVKIIQLVRNGERYELTGYSKIPYFTGVTSDITRNKNSVVEALKEAFSRADIKQKNIVAAIPSESLFIRNIKLPMMVGPELAAVIRSEVEKFIPFSIQDAEYDWDILQQYQESGEMEVAVVATQNQTVMDQIYLLKSAGSQPLIMDAQPLAILRALEIGGNVSDDELKGIAVLDLGAGSTQMMIYYLGSLKVTRVIATAGTGITNAIAEKLQITYDKAEAIKSNLGDVDYSFNDENIESDSYRSNQVIRSQLSELIIEINRSLEYFRLQYHGAIIHEMILTGGGSKLRNLSKYIQQETGFTVRIGDPLYNLRLNLKQNDRAVLLGNPNQFSVAIGLALRGVE